jgi:hypothetical protein
MNTLFILFWAVLIFASIAWYAFLLFYIGVKGGKEIGTMARALQARPENAPAPPKSTGDERS